MSEQTRYRVTGAVFLIALAVIVAPMLFDGDGLPKVDVKRLSSAKPMQPVQAPADAFAEETFTQLTESTDALRGAVDDDGFRSDNATGMGEIALAQPDAQSQQSASESTLSSSGNSLDLRLPGASPGAVWAVQVASFQRADNARTLRDSLREAGHEGFLSTTKRGAATWTRVVVGPFLDKAEAQRVAAAISTDFSVTAELRQVVH